MLSPFAKLMGFLSLSVILIFQYNSSTLSRPSGSLSGLAQIIDGDTIDIGGKRIRLYGIDAPEAGQKCKKPNGGSWPCGKEAIKLIAKLAGNRPVHCIGKLVDDFGRLIATCAVGELEINREMVRRGLAWNFDKYSMTYKDLEQISRNLKIGVFQAPSITPWAYRAKRWEVAVQIAPEGCPIKGNITKKGKVYHAPWSPWYKRTKITVKNGERWFCSEAEALSAGWRAPRWK